MRNISSFFRNSIRSLLLIFSLGLAGISIAQGQEAADGAAIFKQSCAPCHQLDQKLTGPALKDVHTRHDEAWLLNWVKGSRKMIADGDPAAVKINDEFPNANMLDFAGILNDDQIKSIFAYIKSESEKVAAPPPTAPPGEKGTSSKGVSDFMLIGLILVIVVTLLIILVLNRIIKTLERLLIQKSGLTSASDKDEASGKGHDAHS